MNYLNHYNRLIDRARNRVLHSYTESHHIIPICMGGVDDKVNLVDLTPEEHYTAHQLLIKIYPDDRKLVHAAIMMTVGNENHNRSMNKLYGWLRRKHSVSVSIDQSGKGNSQFGTVWMYNRDLDISRKIKADELSLYIDLNWVKGRNLKKKTCEFCNKEFFTRKLSIKACSKDCEHKIRSQSAQNHPLSRGVISHDSKFKSLSAAARYYGVDVETIRYRIKIGKYNWID
jgi:hypothetical protein